jgi:predicted ATPase
MSDSRSKLQGMFKPAARFGNFGSVINKLVIKGFRVHGNTTIRMDSPISAIAGPNGCGKSTVVELAAACYASKLGGYSVSDFFAIGPLDPEPFASDASLIVEYDRGDLKPQELTISRDHKEQRWRGYDDRPEKAVLFLESGRHVARRDRSDEFYRSAASLVVGPERAASSRSTECCSKIMGARYTKMAEHDVSVSTSKGVALVAQRDGIPRTYSEMHMGCGEARIQSLVSALEGVPERSLVLLEEPESAVHFAAQYRLGEYLVEVAASRRLQIILTTHSEHLLRALPVESRIYLNPTTSGIDVMYRLTAAQAASFMTDGKDVALTIMVEDDVARQVLQEVLAAHDPTILKTSKIVTSGYRGPKGQVGGGDDNITKAMNTLASSGVRVAAVLDGDSETETLLKLPGNEPPEMELFKSPAVQSHWTKEYKLDVGGFLARHKDTDHHYLFESLAAELNRDERHLVGEAARVYAGVVSTSVVKSLLEGLREAMNRK